MIGQPPTTTTGLLDFSGRTVVITGTSSGMGAEAARLFLAAGAEVHALDIARPATDNTAEPATDNTAEPATNNTAPPVAHGRAEPATENGVDDSAVGGDRTATPHRCDLGEPASIDATVSELPDRVDALVNCAGVPNGGRFTPDAIMRINWLGLRHLTESLLGRLDDGGAVVNVASTAGRNWAERRHHHEALMLAESFDEGLAWVEANPEPIGDGYAFSKETVQYYTLWRAVQLLPRGIRMNSVCPGITDTSIIDDFRRGMGADILDHARAVAGRIASPAEMAPAMLFLADGASSSYLNGVNLNIDRGTGAARDTDQSDPERIWGRAADGAPDRR